MNIQQRTSLVLKLFGFLATLISLLALHSCATSTRPSADIPELSPHPAPINNFQVVGDGIYRSGQPKGETDWKYLEELGITTVIKLNHYSSDATEADEIRLAALHHIEVVKIYLDPEDFPKNLNPWVRPKVEDIAKAVGILNQRGNKKILVHCSHGKDRTGLVIAVYSLQNKNMCKQTAYDQMRFYGANPFLFGVRHSLWNKVFAENPQCK